jgi:hypothetical protein
VTNNVAEYETLVNDLRIAIDFRVQRLYIHDDSKLIINQVMGELNCRDPRMAAYRQEVRKLEEKFDDFKLHHILQRDNEAPNALAWLGSSCGQHPLGVFVQDLARPSIWLDEYDLAPAPEIRPKKGDPTPTPDTDPGTLPGPTGQARDLRSEVAAVTKPSGSDPDWQKLLSKYLRLGVIPNNEPEAQRLARRATGYTIHDDELYLHNTLGILQWCISIEEGKALLLDIHEGICGYHASSKSMVGGAFRQGFY